MEQQRGGDGAGRRRDRVVVRLLFFAALVLVAFGAGLGMGALARDERADEPLEQPVPHAPEHEDAGS